MQLRVLSAAPALADETDEQVDDLIRICCGEENKQKAQCTKTSIIQEDFRKNKEKLGKR